MPSVSRERIAEVNDYGVVEERLEDVDGTTIQFLTFREDVDATPLMKGLPDDRCHCPHWGYVFTGRLTFATAEGEEVYEAGEAFYITDAHVPRATPGTEYLQFSPQEPLQVVSEQMKRNFMALQGAA
jgi:hypothetical protein